MTACRAIVALLLAGAPLGSLGAAAWRHAPSDTSTARYSNEDPASGGARFESVDIYADSGETPLAAWQLELVVSRNDALVVGVEGGDHPAFVDAPFYDPAALSRNRVILGAFNTGEDLPTGRTRIARIHLRLVDGAKPEFTLRVQTAADRDGVRIDIQATTSDGDPS